MNRTTTIRNLAFLATASLVLTSRIALAEKLPRPEPTSENIVIAKVIAAPDKTAEPVEAAGDDAAVAEALQGVLADNRLELGSRLSDQKSILIASGR